MVVLEFAAVVIPPPPNIYIELFKYPAIGYDCQISVATEVSDIVIWFQLGRSLTLLLMCNVGKAGSDESSSIKGNGNEKQPRGGK